MADVKDELSTTTVDLLAAELSRSWALPDDFGEAAQIIETALCSATFTGWMTVPVGTYVARAGIDQPELALATLVALTPRFSSE